MNRSIRFLALTVLTLLPALPADADWVWVEGEEPSKARVTRHPQWYDSVKRDELSGGDFISNWGDQPGLLLYQVRAPRAGEYDFWVRANPVQARLWYGVNGGDLKPIDLEKGQQGNTNVAADGKVDLRFLAWVHVGRVPLKAGANAVGFRMDSENNNHGYLDCFVLSEEPFAPRGIARPGEASAAAVRAEAENPGWFAFDPPADPFRPDAALDLRSLNEEYAGAGGFIGVKGSEFVHANTGEPVRFWGVNGPPGGSYDDLRREARLLAKRGVNLVRIHHGYFDEKGNVKPDAIAHALDVVDAMKQEGIYSHFSIYFPLWLTPGPDNPSLEGYDGSRKPFAALYFNEDFQRVYRSWWEALLTTPSPRTGKALIDEPAVFGLEMINEDSYFFWTFSDQNIPDPQLRILETQFGDWLVAKYGGLDRAFAAWGNQRVPRDAPAEGRVGFRPLWNIANERSARDKDTARFLLESQRGFYEDTYSFLRDLGFKGVITASNWTTASAEVLGPLEKYSYTAGDFIDRHGYFSSAEQGDNATWSVRDGHTYVDRSALRFDPEEPGKPKDFSHPVQDPSYDGLPSMISETTFNRPNRYRSEAPLYYAAYGALQGSDAVVHFALDGTTWSVKPGYFMQPWTLMSPAMIGQFPAAALIFRRGLVEPGDLLVDLDLSLDAMFDLRGTALAQRAALDELRRQDVGANAAPSEGSGIDPLVHYAGRVNVDFTTGPGTSTMADTSRLIDREGRVVTSSNGQLRLDYGKGLLTIDAPAAQGVSGALNAAGTVRLKDLTVESPLELGHVVAVALDGKPLAASGRIFLQVMTEEKANGFQTEPLGDGTRRIVSIGQDPWLVKDVAGTVRLTRPDAGSLRVTPLDDNGMPGEPIGDASEIQLRPETLYYLIAPAAAGG